MDRPSGQDGELVKVPLRTESMAGRSHHFPGLKQRAEEFLDGLRPAGYDGPTGKIHHSITDNWARWKNLYKDSGSHGFRKVLGLEWGVLKEIWMRNVVNHLDEVPMDANFTKYKGVVMKGSPSIGFSAWVWVPEFDKLVSAETSDGVGSLVIGDVIELTIGVALIGRSMKRTWVAKKFTSNYRRVMPSEIEDSKLLEIEIIENTVAKIEKCLPEELSSMEVEIIEWLNRGNYVRISIKRRVGEQIEIPKAISERCIPSIPEESSNCKHTGTVGVRKGSSIYLIPLPDEVAPRSDLKRYEERSVATIDHYSRVYREMLKDRAETNSSERPWMVFCDETGSAMKNAAGVGGTRKCSLIWIIVGPECETLPPTNPYFHAMDAEIFSGETKRLGEFLGKHLEGPVSCLTMQWEQGSVDEDGLGNDGPMFAMWNFTLPIVLHEVYKQAGYKSHKVEILLEQFGQFVPLPSKFLFGRVQDWVKSHQPDSISAGVGIVPKNPGQHPWMAYTDAIGILLGGENVLTPEQESDLFSNITQIPYLEAGLVEHIGPLLKLVSDPKRFLIQLFDLPLGEFNAYSESVLCEPTTRALGSLGGEDWEAVIGLTNTSDPRIARIAQFICDLCSDSMYEGIVSDRIKFEFGMMKLGYSRHKGDWRESELWSDRIDELRVGYDWYWPRQDRFWGFINLKNSIGNDRFDFRPEKLEEELRWFFPERDGPYPPYARKSAGSVALTKGLRAEKEGLDAEEAIRVESRIFEEEPIDNDDLIFRYTMKAELAAEFGDPSDVYELLMVEMTNRLGSIGFMDRLEENPYLCAVLLKSIVNAEFNAEYTRSFLSILCGKKEIDKGKTKQNYLKEHVERGNNPSQRVAYWFIRAALKYSRESNRAEFADEIRLCADGLIRMISEEKWRRDASGVIIACELLDLSHRGITGIDDPEDFLDTVLENSHQSTKDWVAKYPPNKDDWLAPLNFNYR